MVEGDGCHRVAAEHRKSLVGRKFKASSPNGRFKDGALAIVKAGGVLLQIEVHGKNLFYFFGELGSAPTVVVHIHFGMAGQFAVYQAQEPETTPSTRLRLEAAAQGGLPHVTAHLSAMTVEHGSPGILYDSLCQKLGPDPLREDAQAERFIVRAGQAKKAIGLLLMDQSVVAGVGNIYRSETLYEAQIHPMQPANTLAPAELQSLWDIVVRQMQAGFKTGSIWGERSGPQCYGLEKSACGGAVKEWVMGGRNCFACTKSQILDEKRKVNKVASVGTATPGTTHLGKMVSAGVAEARKRKAGESLAVQHVALKDDRTLAQARAAKKKPAARVVKEKGTAASKAVKRKDKAVGPKIKKRPGAAPARSGVGVRGSLKRPARAK